MFAWDSAEVDEAKAFTAFAFVPGMQIYEASFQPPDDLRRIRRQGAKKLVHLAIVYGQNKKIIPVDEGRLRHAFQQCHILAAKISVEALSPSGDVVDEREGPDAAPGFDADFLNAVVGLRASSRKFSDQLEAEG